MERNLKIRSNNFAHDAVNIALFLPQTYLGNHIKQGQEKAQKKLNFIH